jgi:hypothetical protein
MKLFSIYSSIIYALILSSSCRQAERGTLDYGLLTFDTNRVAIFQWDTTKYVFPNNSDPLALTQGDLSIVDSLLQNAIDSFNAISSPRFYLSFNKVVPLDSFTIDPTKYKIQFFPYKDVNGQRIVSINGFNDNFPTWKNEVYADRLHFGIHKFELKVNLSDTTHGDIQTGSYG